MHRDVVRIAIRQKEGHVVQRCCVIAAQIFEKKKGRRKQEEKEREEAKRARPAGGPSPPNVSGDSKCPAEIYQKPKSFHMKFPIYPYRSP